VYSADCVCNAGPDQQASAGAEVTLDASGSYDPHYQLNPQVHTLEYSWRQIASENDPNPASIPSSDRVVLKSAESIHPSFTAPARDTTLYFELDVRDLGGPCTSGDRIVAITVLGEPVSGTLENPESNGSTNPETSSLPSGETPGLPSGETPSVPSGETVLPKASNLAVTTQQNMPVTVKFSATGSGDLKGQIVKSPENGELGPIDQAKGTVVYTPSEGYLGRDSFTYVVSDGVQGSNVATVEITVNGDSDNQNELQSTSNITSADGGNNFSQTAPPLVTSEEGGDVNVLAMLKNLPSGSITTDKLADGAVTTDKLADEAGTTEKLSGNSVTSDKIGDQVITHDDLSDGSVTSPKIAQDSVTADKIAGVNKLIFSTCTATAAEVNQREKTCSVPGAAEGDAVLVTPNIPCQECYQFDIMGFWVSSARSHTDNVEVTFRSQITLAGPRAAPSEQQPRMHSGTVDLAIIVFRQ